MMDKIGHHGLSQEGIDALKALFVVLAFIAVVLRLIANWKYNSYFLIDDYISMAAIPFLVAVSVLSDIAGNGFHDPNSSPHKIAELAVAIAVTTPFALWTCKAPILLSYLRVFDVKKWLRTTSLLTLVLMALVYISGLVAIPPACMPRSRELSDPFIANCQRRTRMVNVYLGIVSLLADVIILVLPMPVIFGLKLMVPSKIGLVFLFLGGCLAIAASVISLYFKAMSFSVPEISLAISILATVTECSIALIVGCVPSLRLLWSKILKPGARCVSEAGISTTQLSPRDVEEAKTASNDTLVGTSLTLSTTITSGADGERQRWGSLFDDGKPYIQAYYQPGREKIFGDESSSDFGDHALQTRVDGVWRK